MDISQANSFLDFVSRPMFGYFVGFIFSSVEDEIDQSFILLLERLKKASSEYEFREFSIQSGAEVYCKYISRIPPLYFKNSVIRLGANVALSKTVVDDLINCVNDRGDIVLFSLRLNISLYLSEYFIDSIQPKRTTCFTISEGFEESKPKFWSFPMLSSEKYKGVAISSIMNNISPITYCGVSFSMTISLDNCILSNKNILCLLRNSNKNQRLNISYNRFACRDPQALIEESLFMLYVGKLSLFSGRKLTVRVHKILESRRFPTRLRKGWALNDIPKVFQSSGRIFYGKDAQIE